MLDFCNSVRILAIPESEKGAISCCIEGSADITLHPIKVGRWYSVQWQWDAPPFDNPDLRRAIAHAIDKDHIVAITIC